MHQPMPRPKHSLPDLYKAINALLAHQLTFDNDQSRAHIRAKISELDPEHFLSRRKLHPVDTIAMAILRTGDVDMMDIMVRVVNTLPHERRAPYIFELPLEGIHPNDGPAARRCWEGMWRDESGHIPCIQSAWFSMARKAIAHGHADTFQWIVHEDGYWGKKRPDRILDGIANLLRISCGGAQKAALIDAITHGISLLSQYPDAPDMRQRHDVAMWAVGCAHLGWRTPTHSRQPVFVHICKQAESAHKALAMLQEIKDWHAWVGLGDGRATQKGMEMGQRPKTA